MNNVSEGKRNNMLFRYALECVRCGIDPHALKLVAMRSGLSSYECEKTIHHAFNDFSDQYGETVLDKTIAWKRQQKPRFANRFHPLIDEVAKQAVAQNTFRPMINQSLLNAGVDRTTISRRLDALCEHGALLKIPMGKKKNSRQLRCNCYELIETNTATGEVSVPSMAETVSSLPVSRQSWKRFVEESSRRKNVALSDTWVQRTIRFYSWVRLPHQNPYRSVRVHRAVQERTRIAVSRQSIRVC